MVHIACAPSPKKHTHCQHPPTCASSLQLQRTFYAGMAKIQDEETQIMGRVMVIWLRQEVGMDRATSWEIAKLSRRIPTKIVALHFCVVGPRPNFLTDTVLAISCYGVDTLARLRSKIHFGTTETKKTKETAQNALTCLF